jgi:hypothetical protein
MTHTEIEVKKVEKEPRFSTLGITLMALAMTLFLGFVVWSAKSVDPIPPVAETRIEPAPAPPAP